MSNEWVKRLIDMANSVAATDGEETLQVIIPTPGNSPLANLLSLSQPEIVEWMGRHQSGMMH